MVGRRRVEFESASGRATPQDHEFQTDGFQQTSQSP